MMLQQLLPILLMDSIPNLKKWNRQLLVLVSQNYLSFGHFFQE